MRIIAGEFRGRKLVAPASDATRPVTDRVKQSIFDYLADLIDGSTVYDCFAGTGSFGLEALSRGARHATFFESDKSAVQRLRRNIETLGVVERSVIVSGDIFKTVRDSAKRKANLIFLDPPYRMVKEEAQSPHPNPPPEYRERGKKGGPLQELVKNLADGHLAPDGWIIFRHLAADSLALPALRILDTRDYGPMRVEFLART